MAMHSGAWTEKFSYPLRQYMTAISPRSLWWKTDADFHHQESVEQTNSWDNISFDPNLQHLQDQRQRGGGTKPFIYTPPTFQPILKTTSPPKIPSVLIQTQQESTPWEFEDIVPGYPKDQTNIKTGKEKKALLFQPGFI